MYAIRSHKNSYPRGSDFQQGIIWPTRDIGNVWKDNFGCLTGKEGCYSQLVSRAQGGGVAKHPGMHRTHPHKLPGPKRQQCWGVWAALSWSHVTTRLCPCPCEALSLVGEQTSETWLGQSQIMAIKWIWPESEAQEWLGFPVHAKVLFTLYCPLLWSQAPLSSLKWEIASGRKRQCTHLN